MLRLKHFTRLSDDDRRAIERLSISNPRVYEAGEDLIREGEKPNSVMLVLEGWVCRYKYLDDGRRQIIAFLLPGDLCDLDIFVLRKMDHSVGAITAVTIAEIPRILFKEVIERSPRVAQAMLWQTSVAFAIQREWTVSIGQRIALERVAHLLCELFLRQKMVGLTNGFSCAFPVRQTELADATGLSVVHVNRTLQHLRQAGLIILKERRLVIPDLQALMDAGLFNENYLHLDHDGRQLDANE